MPIVILKPYFLAFRNRFRFRASLSHSIGRDLLVLVVTAIIMVCIFLGFVMILNSMERNPLVKQIIPTKIVELLFYAFFFLLLITNTIAATGNIFAAHHMDLLLTTPVSGLKLYLAKLCEMLAETSLMFVIFIMPVGFAYAYSLELQPGVFIGSLLVVAPFLLIPAGVSVLLATVFVRFAAVVWRRGMFLFLCIVGLGAYVVGRLLSMLQQVQINRGGANAIVQLISLFDNPNPFWLPSRWAVDLLNYYVTGVLEDATLKAGLLWSCAAGSLALGFLAFDFFLLPVRSAAAAYQRPETAPSGRVKNDVFRSLFEAIYLRLPINAQFRAVILKDLTSVVRDRAQSLQLLLYLGIAVAALVILEFMSTALVNMETTSQQSWWAFLASCNVLFTGFVITALMTRLVYPSISLEGRAFWILITAPIDLRRLIAAKFLCWLPLIAAISLSLLAAGVFAIHLSWPLLLGSMFVGISLSIGCTGLALGIGAIFATFEWESPTQIAAGFGTLVLLLSSLALVVLSFVPASTLMFLCTVPVVRKLFGYWTTPIAIVLLGVIIFSLNAGVAYFACRRGVASLAARNG